MARTSPKPKTSSASRSTTKAQVKSSRPAARKVPAGRTKVVTKKPATSRTPGAGAKVQAKKHGTAGSGARAAGLREAGRGTRAAARQRPSDGRPPQAPSALIPYLTVRDAEASIGFYERAFGFAVHGPVLRDDAGQVMHVAMRLGDAVIMFAPQSAASTMRSPADSGAPDSFSLYLYVPEVDRLAEQAEQAGAQMLQAPADQFWGDRIAIFKDPNGYHWTFATNVADFDPTAMPE